MRQGHYIDIMVVQEKKKKLSLTEKEKKRKFWVRPILGKES